MNKKNQLDDNEQLENLSSVNGKVDQTEIINMLLRRKDKRTLDSDTMILESQKRMLNSLTKGIEYEATVDESDLFLRKHVSEKLPMVVMYVDLVGSTDITLKLPEEKVAIIISSFAQEMAISIKQHNGFALKFVGDAVIGYFIDVSTLLAADKAIECAKNMIAIMERGINPILNQHDYPDLYIKIGIDFGMNMIVRYGSDKKKSHVDILGPAMNMAAKIQNMAKPQQILIGADVYKKIHPTTQTKFKKQILSEARWKYRYRSTGKRYPIYGYVN
jgi:class 3 adenylate cyclase